MRFGQTRLIVILSSIQVLASEREEHAANYWAGGETSKGSDAESREIKKGKMN